MAKILVVNLHGMIGVPRATKEALAEMGVGRRFAATVVGDDPVDRGALALCKDYVAWAPVDSALLAELLKSRGRVSNAKALDEKALKGLGVKTHAELADKIIKGDSRLSSVKGLKPFFGLSPPRGGFKRSSRRQFGEGGILGENPQLPEIVRRML